ncbi:MAG: LLM class flavin-dependent oxidoreductase, partial [Thaumarchaeota archaeon]|nr:LLM class flavin-dependent oxidoreductase [Nitrososphaerota archaeon]
MLEPPKFGLMVGGEPPFATATDCISLGVRAEKDGYDSIWVPDHLIDIDGSMADPWSTLGYLSAVTRKLLLYTSVTDYQKVHPAKLAQILATLDELSRGRMTVGIGAGEKMNNSPFGVPWDEASVRVDKLREYIEVMRVLWRSSHRDPVSFEGTHFRLENAWLDQKIITKPTPRVCIGAMGSTLMLRLIGTHGDAWLPTLMTPDLYRKKLRVIAEAARKAGRDAGMIERVYYAYVVASEDSKVIADFTRSFKATIATLCPFIVEAEGVKLPKMKLETNFQRMVVTNEALKELEAQAESIPDSLVRKTCAVGGADEIIDYLEEAIEAGAQHFCLAATRGQPEENLKVL